MSQLPNLPHPAERPLVRAAAPRLGVTLLELLVVVAVLGLATAIVVPALRAPAAADSASPVREVISGARALAVRRGEPVRLRIEPDGVWAVVGSRDGTPIERGRVRIASGAAQRVVDLVIDGVGNCVPTSVGTAPTSYDPIRCTERES